MAKDKYHNVVRTALEKEGWTITADPYILPVGKTRLEIDSAATLLAATQGEQRIAIEVKVFQSASLVNAFHLALGQFLNYRLSLELIDAGRELFLAVPNSIYESFLTSELADRAIRNFSIRLIVFDPEEEVIIAWH